MHLHRSCFNSEFETLFESTWPVVPGLLQREGKVCGYFKTAVLCCSLAMSKSTPEYLRSNLLHFVIDGVMEWDGV